MNICVPIVATSINQAQESISQAAKAGANLVEVRLDYLMDLNDKNLKQLIQSTELPIIITPRSHKEGGKWHLPEEERFSYAHKAVEYGADYVDVELHSNPDFLKKLIDNKNNTQVILSYHNFIGTPALEDVWFEYQMMMEKGADIGKIATKITSVHDNLIILQVLSGAQSRLQNIIAVGMGEMGKITRVMSSYFGGYLTYASLAFGQESAEGQMTLMDLQMALKHIN